MSDEIRQGDRLDRFKVLALLGEGAMARVFQVEHVALGTHHAVKVLTAVRSDLLDRMLQEGRVQARLKHPNVVAVSDVVELGDTLGLVMEFVDGVSLEQLLERRGPLSVNEALPIFRQMLAGVGAAHAAGVLHRDLKPANILLAAGPDGLVPKITDFGIAKVFDTYGRAGKTRALTMMGTPGYAAPEQWYDSRSVDARADIFSLGAMLYEMLSGRVPYPGKTALDAYKASLSEEHPSVDVLVPGLPDWVVDAVERAIEADPDARFETVEAFALALAEPTGGALAAARTRIFARPAPASDRAVLEQPTDDLRPVPVPDEPATGPAAAARAAASARRPLLTWVLLVVVALLALGAVGLLLLLLAMAAGGLVGAMP